jgi:hypothetical protein
MTLQVLDDIACSNGPYQILHRVFSTAEQQG